jgi:hypothetical protein
MQGDAIARFDQIMARYTADPRVTAGKMFSAVGLKVDGKIFAMLPRSTFVLKLPAARIEGLIGAGRAARFDPGHGRLMREWAVIDPAEDWESLAGEAYAFVSSLSR